MSRSILNSIFVIAAIIFAAPPKYGQKNRDVCRVWATTWKYDQSAGVHFGSPPDEIGKFPIDNISETEITREKYRYEVDGKIFHIAVDVSYEKKDRPGRIELGVFPARIDIGLFVDESKPSITGDYYKFVRAGTTYGDKWGQMFVRKFIEKAPDRYEFHFMCSDGVSKDVMHRDEPKPPQKKDKQ